MNDAVMGHGTCWYTKGGYLGDIADGCIEALIEAADGILSPVTLVEFSYQHGAQARLAEDDAAFADRHADFFLNIVSNWHPRDAQQPHIEWAKKVFERTSPWQTGGVYTNFFAVDDDARVTEAYRGEKYERLARIKTQYDPDNVFSKNPNIKPAVVSGNGAR
jgi:FAD/FMN-containing dehydrogenase